MKKTLVAVALTLMAVTGFAADKAGDLNPRAGKTEPNANENGVANGHLGTPGGSGNLVNHGGGVMSYAHVVCIFWGPSLASTSTFAREIQSFRNSAYGMVSHTSMLNQYGVYETTLQGSQADRFDTANPPSARVTDTMVQAEVAKYFKGAYDTNAIYEVFLPSGYYADDGSGANSCGGPNLQYCAYHSSGNGSTLPTNVKYSIEPYPSCSGCQVSGFNVYQNAEHFMVHETREALSDPYGSAWYDAAGYEADDKCAWTALFTQAAADGHTYGYQPEYSNSARTCVQ
jgi:hypothetical protein